MGEEREPVVLVESDDDFGVAVPLELVASGLDKLLPNALVIVQLAIDNSMDGIFKVVEGLGTVRAQVIDGKTDMAES